MSQEAEPDRPRGKPGRRGTPVHDLGAGRAETAERRVKELEAENESLREAAGRSHETADWHGPLVAAERRVAELERHDCERWADEGIGCALCNPSAITLRESWARDPVRIERNALRARVAELEAALRGVQTTSRFGCWCDASHANETFGHQPKCNAARAALEAST